MQWIPLPIFIEIYPAFVGRKYKKKTFKYVAVVIAIVIVSDKLSH